VREVAGVREVENLLHPGGSRRRQAVRTATHARRAGTCRRATSDDDKLDLEQSIVTQMCRGNVLSPDVPLALAFPTKHRCKRSGDQLSAASPAEHERRHLTRRPAQLRRFATTSSLAHRTRSVTAVSYGEHGAGGGDLGGSPDFVSARISSRRAAETRIARQAQRVQPCASTWPQRRSTGSSPL
jgi:hypothetical protein